MPLAAMFILFESIVHNPTQSDSKDNLLFLDIASGYFGRLEYESSGSLQGSIFSEFSLLAREFVRRGQNTKGPASSSAEAESGIATVSHTSPNGSAHGDFHIPPPDTVRISKFIPIQNS
jgi:hypothetical protein